MDRIERTGFHAASVSKTAVITAFRSFILHHIRHHTVLDSIIIVFFLCFLACSAAFHKCNLPCLRSGILSHDLSDLGSNRRAAYRTSAHFSLAFYNRGSQTGTSGVSAASTVISRKHTKDRLFSFIDFHRKFLAGHSKEDTDKQSCSADDRGGDQNSCQHTLRPP